MGLGIRRPLCCFCWLFLLTIAGCLLYPGAHWIVVAAACATLLLSCVGTALLLGRKHCAAPHRIRAWYCAFLALAVLLGALLCTVRADIDDSRTEVYAERTEIIHATVVRCEYNSSYGTGYTVLIEKIGEEDIELRAYLECAFVSSLQAGDRVVCTAQIADLRLQENVENDLANGSRLYLTVEDEAQIISVGSMQFWEHPLLSIRISASRVQGALSVALREMMGKDAGALCAALLLGDRSALGGDVTLHFRRSGVSHLLALSGMHLGIIMAAVSALLLRLRLPYRVRFMMVSLVALAYLILTGCAISTVRATVMLLYLQLSGRCGRDADGLTSLSLFLAACVAWEPYMLFDISLWLSSLAAAVPVAILPALQRQKAALDARPVSDGPWRRGWHLLCSKLLVPVTISVLCTLILIVPMWVAFGEVSYLSPLSTLLLTLPVTAILCLGLIWLALVPLGAWSVAAFWSGYIAAGMERIAEVTLDIAAYFSSWTDPLLSLRYASLSVLIPAFAVVLCLVLLAKLKRRYMALLLSIGMVVGCVSVAAEIKEADGTLQVRYVTSGNSELLWLGDTEENVLCDFSDGSYSAYATLLQEGLPAGHTEIDALLLTHYHSRHVATLERLMSSVRVRTLYLPLTMNLCAPEKAAEDEGIARKLQQLALARDVEVVFYDVARTYALWEDLSLVGLQYAMIDRSAHPTVAAAFRYADGAVLTFAGAAFAESLSSDPFVRDCIADSEAVVLGAHGPLTKHAFAIDRWDEGLQTVLLHTESAGGYLDANEGTLAAFSDAQCITLTSSKEGQIVQFSLRDE